jgi:RNA polymerase sigma factor for flagellar operon FliA
MESDELAAFQSLAQPHQMISLDHVPENPHGDEGLPLAERLADPSAQRPDTRMLNVEAKHLLTRCLRKLPKTQVTVITLHYLKGVPLCEIAAMLSVTPSRVSQLHHQALARLRQSFLRLQSAV